MKRGGILHPELSHLLASMGHTDYFTVCDRGFPVPEGPRRIDLALVDDMPTVVDVLRAVHAEWSIDRVLITCDDDNPGSRLIIERNGGVLEDVVPQPDRNVPKRRYWVDVTPG